MTPDITLRLDEEREWQTSKTIPIHGELALHAQISQEEGAYYEDLLQKDDKLKLQYRIIHESSGAVKEYTLPFGWNKETGEKTYHAVLPIGWRNFTKLHIDWKWQCCITEQTVPMKCCQSRAVN